MSEARKFLIISPANLCGGIGSPPSRVDFDCAFGVLVERYASVVFQPIPFVLAQCFISVQQTTVKTMKVNAAVAIETGSMR